MRLLRAARAALRDLLERRRFERDLREEIDAYLELDAEARERRGASPGEARRQARAALGGLAAAHEAVRDVRLTAGLDALRLDLRYGARLLRRSPLFTAVAVATLALGIGANTAVFSAVRSVLLAPLPFAESERLVRVRSLLTLESGESRASGMAPRQLAALAERSRAFSGVAGSRFRNLTLVGEGPAERIVGIEVSTGWSRVLGVAPAVGRSFDPEEERGERPAALVSHSFWQRRLGGDPAALGAVLRLDRLPVPVIGVMPPQFHYPYGADVWIPAVFPRDRETPGDLNVVARLADGVTLEQARDELAGIAAELERESARFARTGFDPMPFADEFRRDPNRSVALMAGAVGFVFLLACVNVAGLLLARSRLRRREAAVRTALGGSRGRQLRQLFTESLLLAAISGALGVGLALAGARWLTALIPPRLGEVVQGVSIDGAALAIAAALSVAAAAGCGVLPALRTVRGAPTRILRGGGADRGAGRWLDALVVVEIAAAQLLLLGALALGVELRRQFQIDVGYAAESLHRAQVGLAQPPYDDPAERVAFVRELEDRLARSPLVAAAGLTSLHPVPRQSTNVGTRVLVDGADTPVDSLPVLNLRLVTPGYLDALGIPLLAGRRIEAGDIEGALPVAVVNRAAAAALWPDRDPLGQVLRPRGADGAPHVVVGVVDDVLEPEAELRETLYLAYAQATGDQPAGSWTTTSMTLVTRSSADPDAVAATVRQAARETDPHVPLFDLAPMEVVLGEPLADRRFGARVMAGFGGFGLLLATLGAYGVTALRIGGRISELALRAALGAEPRRLLLQTLTRGLTLVAAGLAAGVLACAILAPLLRSTVPTLEVDLAVVGLLAATPLAIAAAVACYLPTRRTLRIDPARLLRGSG